MVRALFHIDLNLNKEYKKWINRMTEAFIVLLIIHVMQALQDDNVVFMNMDFIQALTFVMIGFSFYYLVWKKLVQFVYEDDIQEGFKGTYKLFGAR